MTSWLDPRWAEADDVSGADNHTTKKKIIRLKKSSFDKSVESLVFSLWKLRDFSADRVSPPPPHSLVFGGWHRLSTRRAYSRGKSQERPDKFHRLQTRTGRFVSERHPLPPPHVYDWGEEVHIASRTEAIRNPQKKKGWGKWYKATRACRWYRTST